MKLIDWTLIRDDWLGRRLRGEAISYGELAQDHGVSRRAVAYHAKREGWQAELVRRSEELSRKAWEQVEIDHAEARKTLLRLGYAAAQILTTQLEAWASPKNLDGGEPLALKDLRVLQQMARELIVDGAGLPKEHKVTVDDSHEEVRTNRAQMRELEGAALEIAHWAKQRREAKEGEKTNPPGEPPHQE